MKSVSKTALGNPVGTLTLRACGQLWFVTDPGPVSVLDCIQEVCGWWTFHKNGNPHTFYQNPRTDLKICQQCGARSTPKKIQFRYLSMSFPHDLCMPCWNKLRRIDEKLKAVSQVKTTISKLKRMIANGRKNQAVA